MPEVKGQEPRVKHTARLHSAAAIIIKERFLASSLDSYRHLFCFKFFLIFFFKRSLFSILVKHKHKTHYQQQVTPCSAWANQITTSRAAVRLVRLIRSGQHEPQEKKKLNRSRSNKAAADWRTRTLRHTVRLCPPRRRRTSTVTILQVMETKLFAFPIL